jgi:Domain of unknown function (DUF222)/HNH endonuclease
MILGEEVADVSAPTPVDFAMDQFSTSLDHLIKVVQDGGLDYFTDLQLVTVMQTFERIRNRMPLVDHRFLADATSRNLPEVLTQGTMLRTLTTVLRLSPGEASRRVRAADAIGDRTSMLGQPLSPMRPHLATAQRQGEVSTEQVAIIERALAKVDRRGFDPADLEAGERLLTEHATTFGPKQLKMLADRVVDAIDPDGSLPDEQLNADRRHLDLRQTRDGAWVGQFRLTGSLGTKLQALLGPLAKPRVDTDAGPTMPATQVLDPRHHGQRMHDALEEVCDRLLRSVDQPGTGGTPATVIVTIDWDDLLGRTGYGVTSDGTLIRTAEVLRLANEAEIVPTVMTKTGRVLDLGRTRRIASRSQTYALIARDGGCSFPGCDRTPEWCERHHIQEWIHGGETNLNNLTLLCRYHHHNFASRGWTCAIDADGLPEWRPPKLVDHEQKPLLNARITRQLAAQRYPTMQR